MPEIIIYHNGICTKSRGALELLQQAQIPHRVRWYLSEPLGKRALKALLKKLGMKPSEMVRRNEPLFQELYEGKEMSEQEWLGILVQSPELLQRPIVEMGDKAIIARPPERVLELVGQDH